MISDSDHQHADCEATQEGARVAGVPVHADRRARDTARRLGGRQAPAGDVRPADAAQAARLAVQQAHARAEHDARGHGRRRRDVQLRRRHRRRARYVRAVRRVARQRASRQRRRRSELRVGEAHAALACDAGARRRLPRLEPHRSLGTAQRLLTFFFAFALLLRLSDGCSRRRRCRRRRCRSCRIASSLGLTMAFRFSRFLLRDAAMFSMLMVRFVVSSQWKCFHK
jgi:hypothetical protein